VTPASEAPPASSATEAERARAAWVAELAQRGAESIPTLIRQLDDRSWIVRRCVVSALAAFGDEAILPLCESLRTLRDDEARVAATVDTLSASRGAPEAALVDLLACDDLAVVCDGLQILGRRRSADAVPAVAALVDHADDNVALAAIEALGRIGGETSLAPLIAAVARRSFFRSFPAIDVLGRTGSPRAVAPLAELLDESPYAVEAARALGRTGDAGAIAPLAALLERAPPAQARAAAWALAEIDDRQVERFAVAGAVEAKLRQGNREAAGRRVIQALAGADAVERDGLCRVLGWVGGDAAIAALIDQIAGPLQPAHAAETALASLGVEAEPQLLRALRDTSGEPRARLLPLVGLRRSAVADIVACLDDESGEVRAMACDALARTGDVGAVAALFARLGDTDPRVAQSALAAIQSLGSAETERLALDAARAAEPRVRRAALRILAYFGYASALEVLLAAMSDPDERIRDAAVFGLPFIEDERAEGALLEAAGHTSPRTRSAAVRALGHSGGNPEIVARLRLALDDADAWVRYYACQALGKLGDREAATRVAEMLHDPAGQVRVAAVEALAQLRGERALAALHVAAGSSDPDVQRAALLGIALVSNVTSLPILLPAARSADPATRLVALSALARYDTPEVLAALGEAVRDADEPVRNAAVALLGAHASREATRTLVAELGQDGTRARVVTALAQASATRIEGILDALVEAGDETAKLLVSALARMQSAAGTAAIREAARAENVFARRAATAALSAAGTEEARALLRLAATTDPDEGVRDLAAAATAHG
jgi:HEAT repeat protein